MEPESGAVDKMTGLKNQVLHIKRRIYQVSEYWYTGMLVILTIYAVLSYVQIDIVWEELGAGIPVVQFLVTYFLLKPNHVLLVLAVIRHLCADKYDMRVSVAAAVIYLITAHAVKMNYYDEVLMMILLMIGAWGISFRKLIKIYFVTVLTVVAGVIAASQFGWIEELVYETRGGRRAFGFTYPTRFASHIFFLMLWYWFLRGKKLRCREALLPVAAGIFVQICSKARLNAAALLLLAVVMVWQASAFRRSEQKGLEYQMKGGLSSCLSLSPIFAALVITLMTVLYSSDNEVWHSLNKIMSSRLSLGQSGMDIYGFQMWGQKIILSGNGGIGETASKYFYIDSAWIQFSLQYGLVMLVILLLLFWTVGIRAKNHGSWILLWILAFASLHAMVEPQMIRLQYNLLILAVFAGLDTNDTGKKDYEKD